MQQNCFEYEDACSNIIYQAVDVSLPISLVPSVDLDGIQVMCCEEPRVECCEAGCGGIKLKVTQTVTYKIPIEYRVEASTGDATSVCKKSNSNCPRYHY